MHQGYSADTAGLIGDRYRAGNFSPIIPDQAIKIGRGWSGVGRESGVNVA